MKTKEKTMKTKKFGVEIGCMVENLLTPIQVPEGWKVERDGSITGVPDGKIGVQIVSKPYTAYKNFLLDLASFFPKLSFNASCGLHVHVVSKNRNDARYKVMSGTVEDIYPITGKAWNEMSILGCVTNSIIR